MLIESILKFVRNHLKKIFFTFSIILLFSWSIWQNALFTSTNTLSFGYGVLINSLSENGQYQVCGVHAPEICFTAHRLPLITYFLYLFHYIGIPMFWAALVKIILSSLLIWLSLKIVLKKTNSVWFPIIFVFILITPRWALNYVEIGMEEPYLIPLMAFLYASFLFSDYSFSTLKIIAITILLCMTMWIKHSMLYFPFVFAIFWYIKFRNIKHSVIMLLILISSVLGIAFFTQQVSGRFTIKSSWEGWNLYKGNNEHTLNYYPQYHLDNLDYLGLVTVDSTVKDEWQYSNQLSERAKKYIVNNPLEFVKMTLVKSYVFFLDFSDTGRPLGEVAYSKKIEIINSIFLLILRLLFVISIFYCFYLYFFRLKIDKDFKLATLFMIFTLLSFSGFHIIGFAYQRHFMPVILPWFFFTSFVVNRHKKELKNHL
ncbi:MAG: hypothetical protein EAZ27_02885 [Cytophagales bacterium]|nr:MAG: hypothetical protein EAZ27_02885 [Cytophagales bacterium]